MYVRAAVQCFVDKESEAECPIILISDMISSAAKSSVRERQDGVVSGMKLTNHRSVYTIEPLYIASNGSELHSTYTVGALPQRKARINRKKRHKCVKV